MDRFHHVFPDWICREISDLSACNCPAFPPEAWGPLSDLNVDEDFPIDGEIIRNEEGDEIELIPAINKNKTELNL